VTVGGARDGCEVLVVDDDEDTRDLLVWHLEQAGYRVGAASSAAVALARIDAMDVPPRLVLLDLMMPGMSADELVGALRGRPSHAAIAVVLISGVHDLEARARALHPAATLAKPVDLDAVTELVARYVG